MAQKYLQPRFDEDDDEALIADLFQALKCTSRARSQPPSPDRSVPPLSSFLAYANNSSQYQTAAANLDFLPQQFWDNRQAPPVDFFYNPPNATNPTFQNQRKGKGRNQEPSLLGKLTGQEIVSMAGTQTGSMSLQRILDVETAETMLNRITGFLFDLMTDKYGSHVFQKLLLMCTTQKQFEKIVNEVVHNPEQLVSIAGTRFGSPSIQKMFHSLKKREVPALIGKVMAVMEPGMLILMREVSGRHLFVDCLNTLKHDHTIRPIYLIAVNNCTELAKDKEGYHVVMKVIETIRDAVLRKQLLTTITRQSVFLAQHPNGNFVLQKVIALHNPKVTEDICSYLKPYVVELSVNKQASHVIQQCLGTTGMEHLAPELIKNNRLIEVAKDQCGNYILQTILKKSKIEFPHIFQELRNKLVLKMRVLQNHQNGKNVLKYL